jgi:HAD superfamily hydrolase (TIGR01456 family)
MSTCCGKVMECYKMPDARTNAHWLFRYGFQSVITPGDIYASSPNIWPFSKAQLPHHKQFARPLPKPLPPFAAILVFNDPRDWGLDLQIVLDLLLSHKGQLGTLSPLNGQEDLPNRGYQQDGQPELWFSNPDLWWAAKYHLPRLGQGGFREALEGVWAAVTRHAGAGVELKKRVIGKPFYGTYDFAEQRLISHRHDLFRGTQNIGQLQRVYMVGDNPESDIKGGNNFRSPREVEWFTALVRTGVYQEREKPTAKPTALVGDVWDAIEWALKREKWDRQMK